MNRMCLSPHTRHRTVNMQQGSPSSLMALVMLSCDFISPIHSTNIHPVHMSLSNRFGTNLVWPPCERKQKVSNQFQTDFAQTYLRVGLESV